MDYHTDDLIPPGTFLLRIQGVDMQNVNALLLPGRVLCVNQAGIPCTPLHPYLLGDTVFVDANNNGVQDPGEPGIGGVEMQLFDGNDVLVATTHTDADGHYTFEVEAFPYTVKIAPSNFNGESGGTLSGYTPTTPEECPATITNDNVLTCDFGFKKPGAVGNRIWNDYNGNGVQDLGEPGINGVVGAVARHQRQRLRAATPPTVTATTSITNIPAGNYTVRVDDTFLPGGLTPTFDVDGVATPDQAALTIVGGEIRTDYDFGYQGNVSLGDRVWNDLNSDGVQDPGEPGFVGVTVNLHDDSGNPLASTVTGADGNYSFDHLAEGTYTIQVDTTTLPAGSVETYDLDGIDTPDAATVPAPAGTVETDVDFGYHAPVTANASLGDRVWNDANGNGIQDAGEAGINGVTVQLLDAANNLVATATTAGDGNYTFTSLAAGTYTVRIVAATLPAGVDADLRPRRRRHAQRRHRHPGRRPTAPTSTSATAAPPRSATGSGSTPTATASRMRARPASTASRSSCSTPATPWWARRPRAATATTPSRNLTAGTYTVRVVVAPSGGGDPRPTTSTASRTPNIATFSLPAARTARTSTSATAARPRSATGSGSTATATASRTPARPASTASPSSCSTPRNNVVATDHHQRRRQLHLHQPDGRQLLRARRRRTLPAGVRQTYDLDGIATANIATFTLAAGANRTDVDFGYRGTGSVGDRVWLDSNGNGVQDAGEAGINGVTVQLLDGGGNVDRAPRPRR